ncbi:relaxase/mobilization nuclease domain-containing protein, partial [Clostridium beijerinckii]
MAVIKAISSRATPSKIYDYLTQEEKTEEKLISGFNCSPNNMINEFNVTKELYNKNSGVQYQHIIQSFDPKDNIHPEKAHELGKELAEKQFKGFEVLIVTHRDKEHIHNHFVVNSVSYENGLKYKATNKSLWDIKRESNRICEREILSTLDLNHKAKEHLTSGELRKELRGEITWKGELKQCINFAKEKSNSIEDFTEYLKQNFDIETRITNKNISYKHPEKKQGIRGSKLGTDYDKEELLNGFIRKAKSINGERNRDDGVKPGEQTNSTEFRSSHRSIEHDIEQTNEPIRSGAYEGREYGIKKTTSDLYNQLREIRSIGNEYSPDARA